ncbi:hypothetical protein ElyMa_000328000 [Elysia marginata]|uniref:Uncharacterized protein n=1 Tax=Elysia marginata TaxID=1093978 RepID=A0AAV4FC34_9GAST|nr:hypothetical protein ElyMa_000328000 [Elysia marginata]
MATLPRVVAGTPERELWKAPIGVRTALAITTPCMELEGILHNQTTKTHCHKRQGRTPGDRQGPSPGEIDRVLHRLVANNYELQPDMTILQVNQTSSENEKSPSEFEEEVDAAIHMLRPDQSPEADNITADRSGGDETAKALCQNIWEEKNLADRLDPRGATSDNARTSGP